MQIDRKQFIAETMIRKKVRKILNEVLSERSDERELRSVIRSLINEEFDPTQSTGMEALKRAWKGVKENLLSEYKGLLTSPNQRETFKVYFINQLMDMLDAHDLLNPAQEAEAGGLEEAIDIEIADDGTEVDGDGIIHDKLEAQEVSPEESIPEFKEEEEYGLGREVEPGRALEAVDSTGIKRAGSAYKQNSGTIAEEYAGLGNAADRDVFKRFLLANLLALFKEAEDEIVGKQGGPMPTIPPSPEFEKAQQMQPPPEGGPVTV